MPGMFGSSLEFVLRSYTHEYVPVVSSIDSDGAMHSFKKECHPLSIAKINNARNNLSNDSITTPIYPFKECHLLDILKVYDLSNNSNILLYADSVESAELNLLFQYHKIAAGASIQSGLEMFAGDNSHNIVNWNPEYQHWSDMKPWEFREWFSLFYVRYVQEWINSSKEVPDTFLKVKNTDVLFDTKNTFLKIIKFCNLTVSKDLDPFIIEWQGKQNYIINEFQLLHQIVKNTVTNQKFSWQPLNVIAEAIIQQRLRKQNYEIRCDGLNTFPTDAKTLYSLLEKC